MAPSQFQPSQEFTDFSKWLAQQGIDMFNLARSDRNTQLAVANAFQKQQADRQFGLQQQQEQAALAQQQFMQDAALRQENWARSMQNPAVLAAYNQAAQPSPWMQQQIDARNARIAQDAAAFTTNYGGILGAYNQPVFYNSGSFIRGLAPAPRGGGVRPSGQ